MVSAAGSEAFFAVALVVICIAVLLLLRHYLPLRSTPSFLLVPIFLALALPVSIILLVPIDLASSLQEEDEASRGIQLPEGMMLVAWRVAYWLTFFLTWFILPLLGEYIDSGYRVPKDRMLYSLKSSLRYYLIVLACLIAGLVYIVLQVGFDGGVLKGLLMALAYVIGLVQAIYLMGHGLVAIPRSLIRKASASGMLRRLQTQAPKIHEKMEDAIVELSELEEQIKELQARKNGVSRDHQEWIEDLVDMSPSAYNRLPSTALPPSASAPRIPAVITDRYLADIGRRLQRARHKRIRFIASWDYLVQSAADTQAVIDSFASHRLEFGQQRTGLLAGLSPLTPYTRYHLHAHVLPALRLLSGGVLALASAAIIWSEFFKLLLPSISIVGRTILPHPTAPTFTFFRQLLAFLWLLYMNSAALSPLPTVKVWGNRALVRRHTYGESATWYATQTAKLTVPLTYNFVSFTPDAALKRTTFYKFLGRYIDMTPLGAWFNVLFPMLVLLPVLAALFNLYARAGRWLGSWGAEYFAIDEDDEDATDAAALYGTGGWREGKALIERELMGRGSLADDTTPLGGSAGGNARPAASASTAAPAAGSRPGRAPTATPSLYIPPANPSPNRSADPSPGRRSGPGRGGETQASRLEAATRAARERENQLRREERGEGEEEDNIFAGFAHRVRNTFESVEAPEWVQELGRRPKWMGGNGDDDDDRGGVGGAGERSRDGGGDGPGAALSGLNRWFGRGGEGRVRL